METMYPHIKVINVSLEINVVSHKSKSTLKYAQKKFILLKVYFAMGKHGVGIVDMCDESAVV